MSGSGSSGHHRLENEPSVDGKVKHAAFEIAGSDYGQPGQIAFEEEFLETPGWFGKQIKLAPHSSTKAILGLDEFPADSGLRNEAFEEIRPGQIKSALAIVNPCSGGGKGEEIFRDSLEVLGGHGIEVTLRFTEFSGHASELTKEYGDRDKFDAIVIVGGDGTVHEVVNALMEKSLENRPILIILPGGTGCNVLKSLEQNVESILGALDDPIVARLDIAKISWTDSQTQEEKTRFWFNCLSWGLGADGALIAENPCLRMVGKFRYDLGGLLAICTGQRREAELVVEDRYAYDDVYFMFGLNNQHAGNDMLFSPLSKLNDGFVDLCVSETVGTLTLLNLFLTDLPGQTHLYPPNVHYIRTRKFRLESEPASPLNLDGENIGEAPFECEVLARQIPILLPRDYVESPSH